MPHNLLHGHLKNLFQAQYGIAPIYNMWNADGAQLIDPATGRFNSGVARKYLLKSGMTIFSVQVKNWMPA